MVSRQLELGFENQPGIKPARRSLGRSSRANWWFERMRGVVNHAHDWPGPSPDSGAARREETVPPAVCVSRTE